MTEEQLFDFTVKQHADRVIAVNRSAKQEEVMVDSITYTFAPGEKKNLPRFIAQFISDKMIFKRDAMGRAVESFIGIESVTNTTPVDTDSASEKEKTIKKQLNADDVIYTDGGTPVKIGKKVLSAK
jgi:hypothetical protein